VQSSVAAPVDRSRLRLSEVARHIVIPSGIVDSLWYDVSDRCAEFGDTFDAWQDGLGEVTLGLREDGTFAATVGGITYSIPRQVAKTFLVMRIVVALASLFPGLTILWTAHRTRTATNTFQKMKAYVMRSAVKGHLRAGSNNGTAIRDANGEQEIPFANGSRILFGAREQGFGRGFDEVDIEVFDEAQILTEKALEDMVAATNQSRWEHGALLFYMGTPPRPIDPGEVFIDRRRDALREKRDAGGVDFGPPVQAGDSLYVECSADANVGAPGGPSLDDPLQVEKANPSYPHRTPAVAVKRLRKNLTSDEGWRREGLGVWDGDGGKSWSTIAHQQWSDLAISPDDAPTTGTLAYAVKFSTDGERVGAAVALSPEAGPVHVEALGVSRMADGTAHLVEWLAARWRQGLIVVDGKAGAGDLANELVAAGVPRRRVHLVTVDEAITAHAGLLRAVQERDLTHVAQPGLDAAVRVAGKRKIGNAGGWGWSSTTPEGDVTSLDAVTLARHAVVAGKRPTGQGRTSGNRTSGNRVGVVA